MPCHPDRVRRHYHDVEVCAEFNHVDASIDVVVKVTRAEMATAMSQRELKQMVLRKIEEGIDRDYGHR